MKQTFQHMEVEIPPQSFKIPAFGILTFTFDRLRCQDFIVSQDNKNGFHLSQDHVGLSIKFSVFCHTKARQFNNGTPSDRGLLGSAINFNVTGSYIGAEMSFGYDPEYYQIIPIIEELNSTFDLVKVQDGRFANVMIWLLERVIPRIMARAGKDLIRSIIPDVFQTVLNPIIEVPNGGWGQSKNLTLSVLTPLTVNQTGLYCRVRLDETGFSPFAELQDNTLLANREEDDEASYYWDFDMDELTPVKRNDGQILPFSVSGKKLDDNPDIIDLEKEDSIVDEIIRVSRGTRRSLD